MFPLINLREATDALQAAGLSPDQVFGNWGRLVWDNCQAATLKEVGDWLEGVLRLWEDLPGGVILKATLQRDIKTLRCGEWPE